MVKAINEDSEFQVELTNAGTKLVVVDFFATWCGPCMRIAPAVEQLATKYPNAVFLKVDVDKCQETAAGQGVSAMPTFILYRNKAKLDTQRGADPAALEEKIKKWYNDDESESAPVKGQMDLGSQILKGGCECLNESDDHPLSHALEPKGGYLESDCDEQLIVAIAFNQPVKIHSLKLTGPPDKGPKNVKIFINQPRTLDFDSAESMAPQQALELTADDIKEDSVVQLRYVKFQNVQTLTVFVMDNQGGGEVTQIDHLAFYGNPINATNMSDFKRVAGKKGESE